MHITEFLEGVLEMAIRKIIKIDEEKCTGCGECITECAEGALKLVDGKAKIIKEEFCDGFGDCIGKCPTRLSLSGEAPG